MALDIEMPFYNGFPGSALALNVVLMQNFLIQHNVSMGGRISAER